MEENTKYSFIYLANGNIPSARAAHATVAIDVNQVMVYGGAATSGGSMADVGLYFLRLQ